MNEFRTREQREAEKALEDAEKRAALSAAIRGAVADTTDAVTAASIVDSFETGIDERARARSTRASGTARQLAGGGERAEPGPKPQSAKPPPHIPYNEDAEQKAAQVARDSAAQAGQREASWFPAWVRILVRRCVADKGRALSELCALPGWARDSVLKETKPYGGADSVAGRNVIALSIVIWHLGGRLKGRISGLPREAYTSLTVGAHGKHYSHSAVWHGVHDMEGELLPADVRGPDGGRVGAGRNRGFMVAVRLAGWMRTIVPDARCLPGWMIAPSGWPFVQVLILAEPSASNSS